MRHLAAYVFDEDAEHDARWARLYDAAENVREGTATVGHVAMLYREKQLTDEQAEEQGVVPRDDNGRPLKTLTMGATIARCASDAVYQKFMAGEMTAEEAYAEAAKGQPGGVSFALEEEHSPETKSVRSSLINTAAEAKAALKPIQGKVFENKQAGIQARVTNQTLGKTHSAQMSVANLKAMGYSDDEARKIHYSAVSCIHELFEQAEHWFFEDNYDTKQKAGRRGAYHFFGMVEVDGFGEFNANVSVVAPTAPSFSNRIFTLELTIENPTEVRQDSLSQRGLSNSSVGSSEVRVAAYRSFVEKEKAAIRKKAEENGTLWLAPNGKPSNLSEDQWLTVRSKAFKDWFGDWEKDPKNASKVLDENGEPLVVYHGSDAVFDVFDPTKGRANMDIQGMFFSPWDIDAGGYGGNVRAFFLNIRNPANEGQGYGALRKFVGQNGAGVKAREFLKGSGFDGVNNEGEEYIAFEPTQIKSATDNRGTFDPQNPNITMALDLDYGVGAMQLVAGRSAQEEMFMKMQRSIERAAQQWRAPFKGTHNERETARGSTIALAMGIYRRLPKGVHGAAFYNEVKLLRKLMAETREQRDA